MFQDRKFRGLHLTPLKNEWKKHREINFGTVIMSKTCTESFGNNPRFRRTEQMWLAQSVAPVYHMKWKRSVFSAWVIVMLHSFDVFTLGSRRRKHPTAWTAVYQVCMLFGEVSTKWTRPQAFRFFSVTSGYKLDDRGSIPGRGKGFLL
jgi:hypothetical protein